MKSIRSMKPYGLSALMASLLASILLSGCVRDSVPPIPEGEIRSPESKLRVGDPVAVKFDTMGGVTPPPTINAVIDEKGTISVTLVGQVKAEGKTASQLAAEIQSLYVPRYYVHCNVTVLTAERSFYVDGEVKSTGKFAWAEDVTLLKAISMAGSFTEYSDRRRVELTRGQNKSTIDAEEARRNPSKDCPVLPGDRIFVRRAIW